METKNKGGFVVFKVLNRKYTVLNVSFKRAVLHNRVKPTNIQYSLPGRFAAVQTDELNGCCSAGRGWSENPMAQPEKDPHPGIMLFAEPVPEYRHSYSGHRVTLNNLILTLTSIVCNLA